MHSNSKIRLVLADDQALIRQGLTYILDAQADFTVVGEAADGEQVVDVTLRTVPDVVLMDIHMPKCTGIEATRRILQSLPAVKILLLTTFDVQAYVYDGIRAGATGYLLKDSDTADLLDGIRAAYQGQAIYRTSSASQALAQALAQGPQLGQSAQVEFPEALTTRELDVLQQMAYGRRNAEIADILTVSEGTVKTHVHRILQKLGVEDRTQAVVMALRQGLVQ